jgi:type IV pilus assembly protein PilM
MVSATGAVWAIDIGNNSLKALHLTVENDVVKVIGLDNIQHGKVLTGAGVKPTERDELIALSLRKFVSKYDLSKDDLIVSVPSQNSFARFVKLPPVEKKRIPEIVNFEAVQQIPFDINDVQWDWQLMTEENSPETKVGIFAIKNEVVDSVLEYFSRENLQVRYVQMAPMALYNYLLYDRPDLVKSDSQAVVILNIGADNSDLVVCTKSTVWQRCILIGGNNFTKAIADTFKLSFEKAEKLKRTAAVSKYARQIFQAMRPVFTDLVSEVQRSLGFYTSSNPNAKVVKIVALGGGTKLRGLLKYLQQTLQIPVEMPDSFKRLAMGGGISPAKFHENVCDFGIVYGLGLQVLDLGRIKSNLLPGRIARSMAWAGKSKYFLAAAGALFLVSLLAFARTGLDKISYGRNSRIRQETSSIINEAEQAREKLDAEVRKGSEYEAIIKKGFEPFARRDVIPLLQQTVFSALPNEKNNPEQKELYAAFNSGDAEGVLKIDRKQRKQIFITSMSVRFASDIEVAKFGEVSLQWRSSQGASRGGGGAGALDEYMMRMRAGGADSGSRSLRSGTGARDKAAEKDRPGFLVIMTGYSPYENIGELMEPRGAEDDRSKWGFITRLLNLDEIFDGSNCQFELYKRTDIEHFKLEIYEVSVDDEMPDGIGVRSNGTRAGQGGEPILIDPLTKETISKVVMLDSNGKPMLDKHTGKEVYEVNDHWFILKAKFSWKDTSKKAPAAPVKSSSPYESRSRR